MKILLSSLLLLLGAVGTVFGQNVPTSQLWGAGWNHISPTGTIQPAPWCPQNGNGGTATLSSFRLHDDGVKWDQVETANGTYNWAKLDYAFSTLRTTSGCPMTMMYQISATPKWATACSTSSSPSTCLPGPTGSGFGGGTRCANPDDWSCLPPSDINSDGTGTDAQFQAFIYNLFLRYGSGIGQLGLGNEYDSPNFWCSTGLVAACGGTTASQMRAVRAGWDARKIAKCFNSSVTVISWDGHVGTMPTWFHQMMGTSISAPAGSIQIGAGPTCAWSAQTVTGKMAFDAVDEHMRGTPSTNSDPTSVIAAYNAAVTEMTADGLLSYPLFNDEWGDNGGQLPNMATATAYTGIQLVLMASFNNPPIAQENFYQWDNSDWPASQTIRGTANDVVAGWLTGASVNNYSLAGTTYTVTGSSTPLGSFKILFDNSKTCSGSTLSTCATANQSAGSFTHYTDLGGGLHTVSGGVVPVGLAPILLNGNPPSTRSFYVDCIYGSHSGDGSSGNPWKGLGDVNSAAFLGGDTLYLRRGCTWNWHLNFSPGGVPIVTATGPSAWFTIDAFGNGAPPTIQAELPVTAAWTLLGGTTHVYHATVNAASEGSSGWHPSDVSSVKVGAVWGTCKGQYGISTPYCTGSNGTAALTANYDFYYSSSAAGQGCTSNCGTVGDLYVYDSIGTNPSVDFAGGVTAVLDGYGQLLNLSGISYVTVQHLRLLNYSWYGVEYGTTGDHVIIANVYADTEVPFNYHSTGFYFHPSNAAADITLLADESHRGYYGFEFGGGIVAATLSNSKAFFNRNAGLGDFTASGTAVAYDHCHFYGNGIGGIGPGDTTNTAGGAGGAAGAGNIAPSTDPHVVGWNQYVPRLSLGYQGPGASPGSDTALNAQLSSLGGAPLSIGIATNFATSTALISQFNTWIAAGYDLNSFGLSSASYANLGTMTIQYKLATSSSVLLTITGTPATSLVIAVGGVTDFSYTITSSSTLSQVKAALLANGHYTVNWVQPCGSCGWVDGSAMLARDVDIVAGQDVKTASWTMPLNPQQFLADELAGSKAWMTAHLTGLGSTWIYLYPGTLFNLNPVTAVPPGSPWVESTALAAGFQGARGASNMQAGRDGISGGYDGVASNGIDPQGLMAYSLAGWAGLSPTQLQAQIQETVEKSSVWGVPYVLYWSAGYIKSAQLALVVSDLQADGATLMTISGLVNFLTAKTPLPSIVNGPGTGLNDYGYAPDGSAAPNLAPTFLSPTLGAGADLGSTYQYDVNGIPQPQTWPNKSSWDIGAQALVPVYLGGLAPGR